MTERKIIPPRTLKGFRDFLPGAMRSRDSLLETARQVFRLYGYAPIDTPALEYTEILLGKAGAESDKQLYRFEDNGGRDVAMRFDLTVPLARFVAQHSAEIGSPFKRYHIGPVWRAENTQRGRFREFLQCDFDVIGSESVVADTETALVIHDVFAALDIGDFTIRLNDRRVLSGLLEDLELGASTTEVLRAIDKLPKIGHDKVLAELEQVVGASPRQAAALLESVSVAGSNQEILDRVGEMSSAAQVGADSLRQLLAGMDAAGVPESRVQIDIAIARGLDYYTGTVFETFLDDLPEIGSVCSGGRYDDLASLYTKQRLPGVGASIGIDRLLAALEELGKVEHVAAGAPILVVLFEGERVADYIGVASELRRSGLGVDLYPDAKKLGNQLKYADRKGHSLAVIIGDDEWRDGSAQLKVLATGVQETVDRSELADRCHELLGE